MFGWINNLMQWMSSSTSSDPSFNIDGTPMCGRLDIHGNPYGITSSSGSMFDNGPTVNIDGSPMCGGVDIHGNPFGVTSHDWGCSSSIGSGDSWSSDTFDSCGSSGSFGNDW